MVKNYRASYWATRIPDDWEVERDSDCVALFHPDGAGILEISEALQESEVSLDDLEEIAAEHLDAGADADLVRAGDFEGLGLSYIHEDELWREWYLKSGDLLVFITYHCLEEDEEKEEGFVDVILGSMKRT